MFQPGTCVRQPYRIEAEQVARGALQANSRGMQRADGWVVAVRAIEAQHDNAMVEHRHVNAARLTPKAEQRHLAGGQTPYRHLPVIDIDERHPSNAATC